MSFSMERAPLGSGELGCPSTLFTWLPGSKTTLPDEDLHPWASTSFGEPPESNGSLERNLGWRRACTTCAKRDPDQARLALRARRAGASPAQVPLHTSVRLWRRPERSRGPRAAMLLCERGARTWH